MDRRLFIAQLMSAAAASFAVPSAYARAKFADLVVTPLADGLTLICGAGGNVTLFDSSEGVLMIDGGAREQSIRLLKTIRKLTDRKAIHTLFNSHWHWDQTGSNVALGEAGTRIIAHENTRLWLATAIDCEWQQRRYEPLPPTARPNQTFYTADTLKFGGEQIDYGHLPQAHTDGDIYVFFRNANVLVAGDVVSVGAYPISDYSTGGWIGGMVNATQALLDLAGTETKIIPSAGPVQSRADLQLQHEMLITMKQRLSKLLAQGMSARDMIEAEPTRDFDAKWGDPSRFIANAWPGLVHRARELGVSIV